MRLPLRHLKIIDDHCSKSLTLNPVLLSSLYCIESSIYESLQGSEICENVEQQRS